MDTADRITDVIALWAARLVLAARPGYVLCTECERSIPEADWRDRCPVCGWRHGVRYREVTKSAA